MVLNAEEINEWLFSEKKVIFSKIIEAISSYEVSKYVNSPEIMIQNAFNKFPKNRNFPNIDNYNNFDSTVSSLSKSLLLFQGVELFRDPPLSDRYIFYAKASRYLGTFW